MSTKYSARVELELTFEFDYNIDPGYAGSRTEPPEAPSIEDLSGAVIGDKNRIIPIGNELLDYLLSLDSVREQLMFSAQAMDEEVAYARAEMRREDF